MKVSLRIKPSSGIKLETVQPLKKSRHDINEQLGDIFRKLGLIYEDLGDLPRAGTYAKAAALIRNFPEVITSGDQARLKIKGVGASISAKIDEFLATKQLKIFEELAQKTDPKILTPEELAKAEIIKLFSSVHGVGPITAERWYSLGHHTLEDLSSVAMTTAQKLGYTYHYQLKERVPREEMDQYNQVLGEVLADVEFMICGSYRRGEATSGDIDCLIKAQEGVTLDLLVKRLEATGIILGKLTSKGLSKFMGIARLGPDNLARRLDLMLVESVYWPFATLYFTGSQQLNIIMRQAAIDQNMRLNEYGLYDIDSKSIDCATEKDIFTTLRLPYLEPTQRALTP